MAGMSDYLETAVLNEVFRNTNLTPPATYVALYTADPTDAAGAGEVSGNGYARVQVNRDGATTPFWTAPASNGSGGMKVENNDQIDFPTASGGAWGTITHFAIFDASSSGNMLFSGALTASKVIGDGDKLVFPANTLVINLD
jgi:hypothetical protein